MFSHHLTEDLINSLNESELYILKYINANEKHIAHMTIRSIADDLSYSTTTIMRFCKKLGFSGFSELKYEIKRNQNISVSSDPILEAKQISKVITKDVKNTLSLLDSAAIEKISKMLYHSNRIHLFGQGISGIPITYIEKLLFSAGKNNIFRYNTSKLCNHAILNMDQDDLLIVVSASGEFSPTITTVKLAKANNVRVFSITPYNKNDIATNADINLHFFGDLRENNGAEFTTRLPVFYLIHVIFESVLLNMRGDQ